MYGSPGPWTADGCAVVGADGETVCEVAYPEEARLMAAAPELLSLVERLVGPNYDSRWRAEGEALIARIKGT